MVNNGNREIERGELWEGRVDGTVALLIGASLSEPHTRELNDKKCLCV